VVVNPVARFARRRAYWGFLILMRLLRRGGAQIRFLSDSDERHSGVRIQWYRDRPELLRGTIASFTVDDVELSFFVENDFDGIQNCYLRGELYEPDELALIKRHFAGGTFVDVGANVGNHSVFAAKVLRAPRVVAFEPEPLTARLCEINIALNGCGERISLHRMGLSDRAGRARAAVHDQHLGCTRLIPADDGGIQLVRGDELLGSDEVGFIKIDTEGFELQVLAGLEATIERCRPRLFVEVENEQIDRFKDFCLSHHYEIAEDFRRYPVCTNYLAVPA
jgi:FkbM family methyltransferase